MEQPELYNDGILSATPVDGWLFLFWETHRHGRLQKSLIQGIRMMEQLIAKSGQWRGWVCNSEKGHYDMHSIIRRLGARRFDEDPDLIFFRKEIDHVQ